MDGRVSLLLLVFISACTVFKKNLTKGNPPGTVKINDTLYIDRTEVANVHWREYWYYLREFDSTNAYQALPDTTVWINWEPDSTGVVYLNNPLVEYYFRHPSFNNYPAVGISYEQAVQFCKWRTYAANQGVYFDENKIKNYRAHLKDTFPIKFYYRLPTKDEWEMIASVGIDSVNRFFKKFKQAGNYNYHTKEVVDLLRKNYDGPISADLLYMADVKSYYPNKWQVYNMIGNIAEMISEKGIAKGGSFVHTLDSCRFQINQIYFEPMKWLGFRCVAVKIK